MLEQVTQRQGLRSLVCLRIEQTKSLVLEMGREREKLSSDLEAEETRAGISDPNHYAYSPLARTLRERRDRVGHSIETLTKNLEEYEATLATFVEEQSLNNAARVSSRRFWRSDLTSAEVVFQGSPSR